MKKSKEIIGLSIVSISEGKEVGTVKELVIDAARGIVAALLIDNGKWYLGAKLLPFESITGLGECAVTIYSETSLVGADTAPQLEKLLTCGVKVVGTLVLSRSGKVLGIVNEINIDATGKITGCDMEDTVTGEIKSLSAERIITFGKDVLIVINDGDTVPAKPPQIVAPPQPQEIQPEAPVDIPAVEVNAVPVEEDETMPEASNEVSEIANETADDLLAKKFEEKQKKYLLGKKAGRRIETEAGVLIIEQGGEITEAIIQKAKLAGKFIELSMSVY